MTGSPTSSFYVLSNETNAFMYKAELQVQPGYGCYLESSEKIKVKFDDPVEVYYWNYAGYYPTNLCDFNQTNELRPGRNNKWMKADPMGGICGVFVVLGIPQGADSGTTVKIFMTFARALGLPL
eukprot:CAMPEP_0170547542 /NCGR_PEP_ID=MMETSP0211-20121228/5959_1 /TAXON_ID=311385 /ORGANISM="Pseudokeronopsis sp., Strain OXSARD2" /LENGTH=123 /DNA_ID=CAMNT_0010852667 /DNA_START=97 /DNA_END=465 /DNA_ORIENTATION=+